MAKIGLYPQNRFNSSGSGQSISPYQPASKLEILNSAGTAVVQTYLWPLGGSSQEIDIPAGQYQLRLTVLDTITAGQMQIALIDDVAGQHLWNTGLVITNANKVVNSPLVSINNMFNRIDILQSSAFTSTPAAAAFAVTYALGACSGSGPVLRRATFTFSNFQTPLEIATAPGGPWTVFNPNGFFRESAVGTPVPYYFRDATGATANVTVPFTACAAAPPAAPTLNKTSMITTESVTISWLGGNASVRVYEGNQLRASISSGASPAVYSFATLGAGIFTFTVSNANGESAKSAELVVNTGGTNSICGFSHLSSLFTWNEPTEGPFDFKAIKFSNSGPLPWVGQIVSISPLKFIIRGVNMLSRTDITPAFGVSSSSAACLSGGVTGEGGVLEPSGFPMPPGYEKVGVVYQPKDAGGSTDQERDVEIEFTQLCTATLATVQIGVTEQYGSQAPTVDNIVKWVDGNKLKLLFKAGSPPWIFARDKTNPSKVSAPTKTVLS